MPPDHIQVTQWNTRAAADGDADRYAEGLCLESDVPGRFLCGTLGDGCEASLVWYTPTDGLLVAPIGAPDVLVRQLCDT